MLKLYCAIVMPNVHVVATITFNEGACSIWIHLCNLSVARILAAL